MAVEDEALDAVQLETDISFEFFALDVVPA